MLQFILILKNLFLLLFMFNELPFELTDYIYYLANNKCSICHVKCNIPYKNLVSFIIAQKNVIIIFKNIININL